MSDEAVHDQAAATAVDTVPAGVCPCLRDLLPLPGRLPLPVRRQHVPTRLAWPVVDAHVHVFPDRLMDAVQRFFHEHYWPVAYRERDVDFLLDHGMADALNEHMVQLVKQINDRYGAQRVTGLATVFPDEPEQTAILARAFDAGLRGIKLHSHVMRIAADDPKLDPIYRLCAERGLPVLFHTGREPNSRGLGLDTYTVCDVSRIRRVLEGHPDLVLVVPHLGNNETREYVALLSEFPNLYLDTTLATTDFFGPELPGGYTSADLRQWILAHPDRILYGTDWPNIPHEWCSELFALLDLGLPDGVLRRVMGGNAARIYGIPAEALIAEDGAVATHVRPDTAASL
ncbi:hypothetical protein THASP1DRAFT_31336 [Thamnocephalis sphaerospora]|uniref:Amidohydrolase-related domain-containing protein n=1 Tax=Thamnocephalis sphaerospora TaxID=78915 RepID=A0A4P9XNN5_9FUNG|nr:hypothetical protein THASP1DRAFT_31336 [Thamnocephalis sphaerospora]|eukprot:RKP06850.1 hypothetical protein THASP1DRAFT_31336 [Thamnocephalis sphaerospora]